MPTAVRDRVRMIAGSGVDLERFSPAPRPEGARFLMVSRPLREKGLPEYLEAARRVKRSLPTATFAWLGPMHDANPSAIGRGELERLLASGAVEHLPECADPRPAIAACSVFVLPSHREGTSKVMLEAMAMGRGVITTDAPGCGLVLGDAACAKIVPVRDAGALAHAMDEVGRSAAWRTAAGEAARRLAEGRFDARVVDAAVVRALVGDSA